MHAFNIACFVFTALRPKFMEINCSASTKQELRLFNIDSIGSCILRGYGPEDLCNHKTNILKVCFYYFKKSPSQLTNENYDPLWKQKEGTKRH
jgi:hypothetical protein